MLLFLCSRRAAESLSKASRPRAGTQQRFDLQCKFCITDLCTVEAVVLCDDSSCITKQDFHIPFAAFGVRLLPLLHNMNLGSVARRVSDDLVHIRPN